jgi:hypothetical protein
MSSDVFVIASASDVDAAKALRQAVDLADVEARRVQDAFLGFDAAPRININGMIAAAGLVCPSCTVVPSLRSAFCAAAEILSEGAGLVVAAGIYRERSAAFLLAAPEAVGRLNLAPRARLAARSLMSLDEALRLAELTSSDVEVAMNGEQPMLLLHSLLDELESRPARWGAVISGELALLVEHL